MAIIYPPSGGADPSANVNITGVWTALDPTQPQQLATRNYVDTHSSTPGSTITLWSNTVSYSAGNFVYYNNAIWCCRATNISSSPSLTNNNWRIESNLDSSGLRTLVTNVNSNTTWSKGIFAIRAAGLSADITITLSAISTFADSDTVLKIQDFILVKADNSRNVILNTTSPDTFSDGTNTKNITGNTIFRFLLDYTSSIWRLNQ